MTRHLHRLEAGFLLPLALLHAALLLLDRRLWEPPPAPRPRLTVVLTPPLTAAPEPFPCDRASVPALRAEARRLGITRAGGRRIAQARRVDLLAALAGAALARQPQPIAS